MTPKPSRYVGYYYFASIQYFSCANTLFAKGHFTAGEIADHWQAFRKKFSPPLYKLKDTLVDHRSSLAFTLSKLIDLMLAFCPQLLKGWSKMPMVYNEFNETSLKLGVLMPPWQHRSFITLHVPSNVPIHYLRDFISKLQSQAKNLH